MVLASQLSLLVRGQMLVNDDAVQLEGNFN